LDMSTGVFLLLPNRELEKVHFVNAICWFGSQFLYSVLSSMLESGSIDMYSLYTVH
jgi:hypothetical protein